ncbi:MAG: DNA primase [Prevotella sp.]|nr:DNA primase [Prevotella sp.]
MIDRQTVERIKDAANIVDVVSEFVTLKKAGANYKGLCPFHDEKTPSFIVSPARGTCHCFGCGKGGNPISFIMEHEQMTYPEALRWLAKKYNIEIQERELSNEEKEQQSQRESMFIVNEWACKYFEDLLHNDVDGVAIGMQYLRSRGFRDDVIKKFQLGYDSDNRYQLAERAKSAGYKEDFLLKTGICYKNEQTGELIDRYAGRVVFPWIGVSGKVVGFTARVLDQRTKGVNQKYVNSPDSEIYHKANELYGIWQAKRAIAKENRVYMVEGQADVISLYQSGIENVVANSGTALSLNQIHMLHRFTANITLLYDGDAAGIHAAMRGTDMLLSEGMNLKVLLIPDGKDPDELARTMSAEELKTFLEENAVDFMQFKTDLMLKGVTDPQKRSEAVSSIVNSISLIPNAILRDTYLHLCAEKSGVKEENLISTMNRMIRERKERGSVQPANTVEAGSETLPAATVHPPMQEVSPMAQASEVEQMLIQMILKHGEKIIFQNIEGEDGNKIDLSLSQFVKYNLDVDDLKFTNPLYNDILNEAVTLQEEEKDFVAEPYFLHHHNIKISQLAIRMTEERFHLSGSQQMTEDDETLRRNVQHLLLDFRKDFVDERLKQLKIEIGSCGNDMERLQKLMLEFKDMQDMRNALAHALGNNVIV